jgi:hypothetical protein
MSRQGSDLHCPARSPVRSAEMSMSGKRRAGNRRVVDEFVIFR